MGMVARLGVFKLRKPDSVDVTKWIRPFWGGT